MTFKSVSPAHTSLLSSRPQAPAASGPLLGCFQGFSNSSCPKQNSLSVTPNLICPWCSENGITIQANTGFVHDLFLPITAPICRSIKPGLFPFHLPITSPALPTSLHPHLGPSHQHLSPRFAGTPFAGLHPSSPSSSSFTLKLEKFLEHTNVYSVMFSAACHHPQVKVQTPY